MAAGTADRMSGMRIALVSPYSWSYPGGVTRHIEALAEQFMASGDHGRVLSPYDPPDRLAARMHRGSRPEARELQDWVIPLGGTIGVKSNGAVSNLPHTPYAVTTMRRDLRAGRRGGLHVQRLARPPLPPAGAAGPLRLPPRAGAGRPRRRLRRSRHAAGAARGDLPLLLRE